MTRPTLGAALAALLLSCAHPTSPPPALPPPLDLGALVPPAEPPLAVPPGARRYDDRPIRAGQCGAASPPGILVSPAVYAELHGAVSDARRLRVEAAALDKARQADRQAALDLEQGCRAQAAELQQRAAWSGTWRLAVGLVVGGLVGLVAGYGLGAGR
jgi:hypothetical protein